MSTISDNIKDFRIFRGLSQRKLAELLDKSVGTVANWEKGINSPPVDVIENICRVLDVTPNQLYGWDPSPELERFMQEQKENLFQIEVLQKQRTEIDERIKIYNNKIMQANRKQ